MYYSYQHRNWRYSRPLVKGKLLNNVTTNMAQCSTDIFDQQTLHPHPHPKKK
jgi:hypothetical protein